MRFMILMIPASKKSYEAGAMPDEKLIGAMMKYNEELAKAGVLLGLDGLQPSSKGARVKFSGGKGTATDGPFAEARELIGGYWMWQVKSKDEAIEWAKRCPAEDGDTLEIRQVFDPADFGSEVAMKEATLYEEVGKRVDANRKTK
jgi:hypothetical protein